MFITKACIVCNRLSTIEVPEEGYNLWKSGKKHIQDAMPEVSEDDREMLMSSICPTCWDKLWGE